MKEPKKYRKKPVIIKAIQWTGDNLHAVQSFIDGKEIINETLQQHDLWSDYEYIVKMSGLKIKTLEGTMTADIGDYIICGVNGEKYPCKPDIFKKTYEEVNSDKITCFYNLINGEIDIIDEVDEDIAKVLRDTNFFDLMKN